MTNEGKAIQIYNELSHKWDSLHYGYITKALMEMAEWKDQQFKEFLEKKRESYYKRAKGNDIETLSRINMLNEIINELF